METMKAHVAAARRVTLTQSSLRPSAGRVTDRAAVSGASYVTCWSEATLGAMDEFPGALMMGTIINMDRHIFVGPEIVCLQPSVNLLGKCTPHRILILRQERHGYHTIPAGRRWSVFQSARAAGVHRGCEAGPIRCPSGGTSGRWRDIRPEPLRSRAMAV